MKKFLLSITLSCLCIFNAEAVQHAVLVAGSSGYVNYRHQADVYHAWQTLVRKGINPENIVTMAYDDIANDPNNPFPGKVFNKPAAKEGVDVYANITIDYKGNDVTPENFLAIIQGEKDKVKGKVLNSTDKDDVFIYFADHGATGLIAFPITYLYADQFIKAIKNMHSKKLYRQLVIYIEACESGSMFQKILPSDINVYATTAANPEESSYATYCQPDDFVNGTEINSCLGDLYSVNFLQNLDAVNDKKETLLKQFEIVKKETNLSHVQQYGNKKIDVEVVGDFEGNVTSSKFEFVEHEDNMIKLRSAISSRDIKLHYLERRHERLNTPETAKELLAEIKSIRRFDTTFAILRGAFNLDVKAPVEDIDFDCLRTRVSIYEDICGKFTDYGLQYVRQVYQTCAQGVHLFEYERVLVDACLNYGF